MYFGIHDEYNHCFEDILMTYMISNKFPYVYMYADGWKFYNDKMNFDLLGGCEYKCNYPHESVMREIIGIEKKELINLTESEIQEFLKQNKFIGIYYDAMYCDWSIAYQKYHLPHYLILNEIKDGVLKGNDPYLHKSYIELLWEELNEHNGNLFCWNHITSNRKIDWRVVIRHVLQLNENMFKQIKEFGDLIESVNVYDYGIKYKKDITACPLFQNITYVVNSRYNLSKLFYYMSVLAKIEFLKNIANEFQKIALLWDNVKGSIIRSMMNQAIYLKNRSNTKLMIYKIAEEEEALYEKVQSAIELNE